MHFCSHDSAPPLAIIYSFSLADPSRIVVQLYAVLPTVRTPDFPFLSGLLSPLHFCQHDDEHMISIRILAMAMLDGRRFLGACLLLACCLLATGRPGLDSLDPLDSQKFGAASAQTTHLSNPRSLLLATTELRSLATHFTHKWSDTHEKNVLPYLQSKTFVPSTDDRRAKSRFTFKTLSLATNCTCHRSSSSAA